MFKEWNDIVKNCVQGDVATLSCIPAVFSNLLTALLAFAGLFALFIFIYSGFRYIHAGGDPKQLEGARNTLIYAIVGLILIVFSFFVVNIISIVTNVPCIIKFGFRCN